MVVKQVGKKVVEKKRQTKKKKTGNLYTKENNEENGSLGMRKDERK